MRKPVFANAKTKSQISFAVTAKLISAFVFATRIVESLYFLHPKFQASSHLLWLYRPVCVGPGWKPRTLVFSQRGSILQLESITSRLLNITKDRSRLILGCKEVQWLPSCRRLVTCRMATDRRVVVSAIGRQFQYNQSRTGFNGGRSVCMSKA